MNQKKGFLKYWVKIQAISDASQINNLHRLNQQAWQRNNLLRTSKDVFDRLVSCLDAFSGYLL